MSTLFLLFRKKKHFIFQLPVKSRYVLRRSQSTGRFDCEKAVAADLVTGQKLTVSTGKFARFADGSATVQLGDSVVMATAVCKRDSPTLEQSFMPFSVLYRQKAAALGRVPTNFLRREMNFTDKEILTSRVIDRSLRPLFPDNFTCPTEIVCNPLAMDGVNHPDVIAINAASAALSLSSIPWNGPIGAVRVGYSNEEFIINPTKKELSESSLNLIVAGTERKLVMLEGSAENFSSAKMFEAIEVGLKHCEKIAIAINQLSKIRGKSKIAQETSVESLEIPEDLKKYIVTALEGVFTNSKHDKVSRDNEINSIRTTALEITKASYPQFDVERVNKEFSSLCKTILRDLIFKTDTRCDGRSLTALRPISCNVGMFSPLHGSAMFQRGETQVLCTVALDSPNSALKLDPVSMVLSGVKKKNFFLHYDFPSYATNEVSTEKSKGKRREIGHGALAEHGLKAVIPSDFPFTIRVNSEVLESNGSSSMATVCAGSMSLMDAGVPTAEAVAGVAIGLVTKDDDFRILTDISGIEDHFGDMDLKIAGTKDGFTAIQGDIKIPGLPLLIVQNALQKASSAHVEILEIMNKAIDAPKKNKENWPVVEKMDIPADKRSKVFGVGGINIKRIEAETGAQIVDEESDSLTLFAPNKEAFREAKELIEQLLVTDKEPVLEFGAVYKAKIVEMRDVGCLVQLYPNMRPVLIHNTQLDRRKVQHPSALGLEVGQEIVVKYFGRDPVSGQIRLSRKLLQITANPSMKSFLENSW